MQKTTPLSQIVKDTYYDMSGSMLDDDTAGCLANAIASVRWLDEWLDDDDLLRHRIGYFFSDYMSKDKSQIVFPTHNLYLRDILENKKIDGILHEPVVFVTKRIAKYLLRDCSVHITVSYDSLKAANKDIDFVDVGGLVVATGDVVLTTDCLVCIDSLMNYRMEVPVSDQEILSILSEYSLQKEAVSKVERGVYKIDQDERSLLPDMPVVEKGTKRTGRIMQVVPGEEGTVAVGFESGPEVVVTQEEFDQRFVVTANKKFPVRTKSGDKLLSRDALTDLIRYKLKNSKVIRTFCSNFGISPERIDELTITIEPLDKKYAETDLDVMRLNESLFESDFFEEYFFVPVHELIHWLSRTKENEAYFNDPEEVLGFVASIAYELERGTPEETIYKRIFPKMEWHFNRPEDAKTFYIRSLNKAREYVT